MITVVNGTTKTASSGFGSNYDGSKAGTELDRWRVQLADPQSFVKETYDKLSSRQATLFNTSPFARACVKKPLSYVVGDGIFYQCLPDARFLNMDKQMLIEWGQEFSELVHYDKLSYNYYEKQRLLLQDASITGDSCLWFDRDEDGFIQDLLASGGYHIDSDKTDESNNIVMGIKTDGQKRRKGLYVRNSDKLFSFQNNDGTQNVIQVFMDHERADQMRGYGVNQAIIALLKNSDTVWDATIHRMVLESVMFGVTKSDNIDVQRQVENLQNRTIQKKVGNGVVSSSSGVPSVSQTTIPVGSMVNMDAKGGMEFSKLETPSANFRSAMELVQKHTAYNRGYTPEFLAGEYPTSYSAGQGSINDSMQAVRAERAGFTRTVENVLHYNLAVDYMRSGVLPIIPGFFASGQAGKRVRHALLSGKFLGPVPGFRNPLAEAKADDLLEEAGVLLKSDRIWKKSGTGDYRAFLDQKNAEQEYFDNLSYKQQEQVILDEKSSV